MIVYSILIGLVVLGITSISLSKPLNPQRSANSWLLIICLLIILLAAFRAPSVGPDTPGYIWHYYQMLDFSFEELLNNTNFNSYFVYFALSKVFTLLDCSFSVWFGILELIYLIPMYLLIRRFSSDYLLSILLFITTGLFAFSLTGLKQTLGMAFMMMAFLTLVDKRYILTIILAVLGYYSHPATGIFIGGLILYLFRGSKYFLYFITAIVIGVFISGEFVFANLVELNGDEHFESYLEEAEEAYSITTLLFYIFLVGISLLSFRNYLHTRTIQAKVMMGMCIVACALQSLAEVSPNAFRLAYLYTPFFMILIPNSINSVKHVLNRQCLYFGTIIAICFYFLYAARNSQYEFIWSVAYPEF